MGTSGQPWALGRVVDSYTGPINGFVVNAPPNRKLPYIKLTFPNGIYQLVVRIDFIERIFDISPEGGSGMLEVVIAVICGIPLP
jgi:hypothetical protein